jgi:hypothetical protein
MRLSDTIMEPEYSKQRGTTHWQLLVNETVDKEKASASVLYFLGVCSQQPNPQSSTIKLTHQSPRTPFLLPLTSDCAYRSPPLL